jgi:hypothetical protein
MKKMRLDLDELDVQSFETGGPNGSGTVKANEDTVESEGTVGTCCGCQSLGCLDTDPNNGGGGGGGTYIGCPNSAFPCQSVNACNTDACGFSFRYPNTCGAVSYPDCSLKCTNILQCTTPDMSCVAGC